MSDEMDLLQRVYGRFLNGNLLAEKWSAASFESNTA